MPTVYAFAFIALLLTVAWLVDRRARRVRRGLERPASGAGGRAADGRLAGAIERTSPGTTTQPGWHHGTHHTP
jgi:hypothetical protein